MGSASYKHVVSHPFLKNLRNFLRIMKQKYLFTIYFLLYNVKKEKEICFKLQNINPIFFFLLSMFQLYLKGFVVSRLMKKKSLDSLSLLEREVKLKEKKRREKIVNKLIKAFINLFHKKRQKRQKYRIFCQHLKIPLCKKH